MKRPPTLDFAGGAPQPWIGLAVCVLAALMLAGGAAVSWQQQQRNGALAAALSQRSAQRQPAARALSAAERTRVAQGERVMSELRAPWGELLSTFEAQSRPDIGLLKLEPDARTGLVRVTAHAKDTTALFAYVKALEGDDRLRNVSLVNHELERDTPGQPLRFTLQAGWRVPSSSARGRT